MIVFALEPLEQAWNECVDLAAAHWMETERYRHDQPFNPVFERYNQYAKLGWYLQFTARDDGRMIGFCGMYLTPSMHTQELIATEDTWFLLPEYRGKGRTFIRFHDFITQELVRRGAVEISMTVPPGGTGARLLEHLDYEPVKVQYSRRLVRADSAPKSQGTVGASHARSHT